MKLKNKLLGLVLGLAVTLGVGYGLANNSSQVKVAKAESGYVLLKTSNFSELTTSTKVVIADENLSEGVKGWDNSKDATISVTKSEWLNFEVTYVDATKKEYSLKDSTTGKWITEPSGNVFKIDSGSQTKCSIDDKGYFKINNRFLCKNGSFYRCYSKIGSYTPFYVYMVKDMTGVPSVNITSTFANLEIGSKGTIEYNVLNATNPVVSFSSKNEDIVSIDSNTGTFEALKGGTATIVVSMTCDETATPVIAEKKLVVNYGLITIQDALNVIEPLGTSETSSSTLSIRGYVINLDGDNKGAGKERMIVLSNKKFGEADALTINVFGVYSSFTERKYMIINSEVTVTGKPAKYNGNGQINSPILSGYSDEAMTFAKEVNVLLDPECAATAVKEETWNTISTKFNALDSYAQAKLKTAKSDYQYDAEIADFEARYAIIVKGYKYSDFLGTVASSKLTSITNGSSTTTIVLVAATVSVLVAFAGLYLLKKRKEQ